MGVTQNEYSEALMGGVAPKPPPHSPSAQLNLGFQANEAGEDPVGQVAGVAAEAEFANLAEGLTTKVGVLAPEGEPLTLHFARVQLVQSAFPVTLLGERSNIDRHLTKFCHL